MQGKSLKIIDLDSQSSQQQQPQKQKQDSPIKFSNQQQNIGFIKFFSQTQIKKKLLMPTSQEQITPWFRGKTVDIRDSLLRLHNQVIDFYNYISPSKDTHRKRLQAFKELKCMIEQILPGVQVLAFGSFATKLYLPDGDIDVAIITNGKYNVTEGYNALNKKFQKHPQKYTQLQYIRKSKVPLIKFVDGQTSIQFDLSIDKVDGLQQLQYVQKLTKNYPQFKYIAFVFKCMLKIRSLGQTYTGGVGSFLLFCMILIYLYETHRSKKYYTLGEHIIKFMTFYGQTDWSNKIIYGKQGVVESKYREFGTFTFISPQDESHDIGKAAFKIKDVFNLFRNRARYLTGKNFEQQSSILKALVNPNGDRFKYYKQK